MDVVAFFYQEFSVSDMDAVHELGTVPVLIRSINQEISDSHLPNYSSEPEFGNLLMSPGIDSQPGGIDSLESMPGLLKLLQILALHSKGSIRIPAFSLNPNLSVVLDLDDVVLAL